MTGKHFSKSSKKGSGKLAIFIVSIVIAVAAIAAAVILLIPSCGNAKKSNLIATHPSITERTQETTVSSTSKQVTTEKVEETTDTEKETSSPNSDNKNDKTESDNKENSDEGVPMQSSDSEVVVVPGDLDNATYFSASFSPYKAIDSDSDEECSLKEVFGSSYGGGNVTFKSDGAFTDSLTTSSSDRGSYAVVDNKLIATYSNDRNMDVSVSSWNDDVPSEIVINYGGYYVYFN